MAEKAPMTRQGYEALVNELKHLRGVVRPQVIEAVRLAREEGDLRENAEYHGAKEKQAIIEAKIRHLETQLANGEIIDTGALGGDRVVFGATVQVREANTDEGKRVSLGQLLMRQPLRKAGFRSNHRSVGLWWASRSGTRSKSASPEASSFMRSFPSPLRAELLCQFQAFVAAGFIETSRLSE